MDKIDKRKFNKGKQKPPELVKSENIVFRVTKAQKAWLTSYPGGAAAWFSDHFRQDAPHLFINPVTEDNAGYESE